MCSQFKEILKKDQENNTILIVIVRHWVISHVPVVGH